MRITKLSFGQQLGWYFSSIVYGLCVLAIGFSADAYRGLAPAFAHGVFFAVWIAGVLGLRLYVQDKDPTSIRSILGLEEKSRRD